MRPRRGPLLRRVRIFLESCNVSQVDACKKCGTAVPDGVRDCPTCGTHHGYPNVKLAQKEAPVLAARENLAKQAAVARNCARQIDELEKTLGETHAVVNAGVGIVYELLTKSHVLYTTYGRSVAARSRTPAKVEHDQQRTAVEGILFGSWGAEIAYAALAVGGRGLPSYGEISLELRDDAIEDRASLLEENSYRFVQRHRLVAGDKLPQGYRAPWSLRRSLGVAKLAERVRPETSRGDHPRLILSARATRNEDDFIEVHIYGTFNRDAVASIQVSVPPKNPVDRVIARAAERQAAKVGIVWK